MRTRALMLTTGLVLGLLVALPALPASAKSISSSSLKNLSNAINKGKHLTYYLQYTALSNGQKSTVTSRRRRRSRTSGRRSGAEIDNGKTTYYCSDLRQQRQLGQFGEQRQLWQFGELGRHHHDDNQVVGDLRRVEGLQFGTRARGSLQPLHRARRLLGGGERLARAGARGPRVVVVGQLRRPAFDLYQRQLPARGPASTA